MICHVPATTFNHHRPQSAVKQVYKSLWDLRQQIGLGCIIGYPKSVISLGCLKLPELNDALQTAVIKALTGRSCGTCSNSNSSRSALAGQASGGKPGAAAGAGAAARRQPWTCLSSTKLIGCDLLACKPGQLNTAAVVEVEARALDASSTKARLLIKSAGGCGFVLVRLGVRLLCS